MMTSASTRCPGSAVSLLCMAWGRALVALALLMFVKGNTAFIQSTKIIKFTEKWTDKKWIWYGFQFSVQTIFWVSLSTVHISLRFFFLEALPPMYDRARTLSFQSKLFLKV